MWTRVVNFLKLVWQYFNRNQSIYRLAKLGRQSQSYDLSIQYKNKKKPDWVVDKVIYLKAIMPDQGCGTIANTFNRLYCEKGESVGKTFLFQEIRRKQYGTSNRYDIVY